MCSLSVVNCRLLKASKKTGSVILVLEVFDRALFGIKKMLTPNRNVSF